MSGNRYKATGSEAEWQPGSDDQVLRNKVGIVERALMDETELQLLLELYEFIMREDFPEGRLAVADIKEWHRLWLGNIYNWAGEERTVNISKDDFHFAAAMHISRLLEDFDSQCLRRYTPCSQLSNAELSEAIAVCHVELILIHPFREGNGRISRLLADVMAVQAGKRPLDYSLWDADKPGYFAAIRQGLGKEYAPMQQLVSASLALQGP